MSDRVGWVAERREGHDVTRLAAACGHLQYAYIAQASQLKISPSAITQRQHTIARRARRFWGDEVLADVQVLALWRREMGRG